MGTVCSKTVNSPNDRETTQTTTVQGRFGEPGERAPTTSESVAVDNPLVGCSRQSSVHDNDPLSAANADDHDTSVDHPVPSVTAARIRRISAESTTSSHASEGSAFNDSATSIRDHSTVSRVSRRSQRRITGSSFSSVLDEQNLEPLSSQADAQTPSQPHRIHVASGRTIDLSSNAAARKSLFVAVAESTQTLYGVRNPNDVSSVSSSSEPQQSSDEFVPKSPGTSGCPM